MEQKASFLSGFQYRTVLLFVVLFAATLPFPLSFFPSPGEFLHPCFQQLNVWSAHLLGLGPHFNPVIESDSPGFYLHVLHLAILAVLSALAWTYFFKPAHETRLKYLINVSATYILAFFLLKYGFDKVFKVQFYLPEPNTLYTPLGMLSKDILFWSTVGSSYSYSVFSGLMEVLPALLLFSRRTRLLGGLIAFGVMLHVLVINFSFDISVKILSIYLLLLSVIVIWPYLKALSGIFLAGGTNFQRPEIESVNRTKNRPMRFVKAFIIGLLVFESLFSYVSQNQYNDDLAPRPQFHGAYEVVSVPLREKSAFFGDLSEMRRVFIHRSGYFIFQRRDDSMEDYPAILSFTPGSFTVKAGKQYVVVEVHTDPQSGEYTFSWQENGKKVYLATRKTDLEMLPLLQDSFSWSVGSGL